MAKFQSYQPFHKSIIEIISGSMDSSEFRVLALLIRNTKISRGHDAIIKSIDKYFKDLGYSDWASEVRANNLGIIDRTRESLLAQKEAIRKKKVKAQAKLRMENELLKQKRQKEVADGRWHEPMGQ